MAARPSSVRLRVVCVAPPDPARHGADFGLQRGPSGPGPESWVLEPGKRSARGDVTFELEATVKPARAAGGPAFAGASVYGPTGGKFLYLSWRTRLADGTWSCRRMKVPLGTITWRLVEAAAAGGRPLEARVAGRGKDGCLACGTVPLARAWRVE